MAACCTIVSRLSCREPAVCVWWGGWGSHVPCLPEHSICTGTMCGYRHSMGNVWGEGCGLTNKDFSIRLIAKGFASCRCVSVCVSTCVWSEGDASVMLFGFRVRAASCFVALRIMGLVRRFTCRGRFSHVGSFLARCAVSGNNRIAPNREGNTEAYS